MKKIILGLYKVRRQIAGAFVSFLIVSTAVVLSRTNAQQVSTTEPLVAIHVSELTQALETTVASPPTPTGTGTTGYEWWITSWPYFVAYESLKEALRSDGTPFVEITDNDIATGRLVTTDGSPRYPIVISLASEAIADDEVTRLRDYVRGGGFLFAGSSAFTRYPDGTTRGDFALANEMGLHMAGSSLLNWYKNSHFTKTGDHRLTSHIPNGTLTWRGPLTSEETPWGVSPSHILHRAHYAWNAVVADAQILAYGDQGPLLTVNNFGQGHVIYHGVLQPLVGHGGYDPGMYAYLIYRRAIEWAFESFNLPIVKVSPWPYPYDAAFIVRHDFENNQSNIKAIESSARFEHSLGAMGDYYFCTGELRVNMGGDAATIASLRRAISNFGATIGSHNGGLKNPNNTSLMPSNYDYWHWGPDEALDTAPQSYPNGKAYASASILASFEDIEGWLTGLDNGRAGCGAAGNCPRTWVSPNFNSTREDSYDILEQLGSVTMGEQKISPFPHRTLSYKTPGRYFSPITLPLSDWYIGANIAQCLTYNDGREVFTVDAVRQAVDFYYNLGALINFYGHMPSNYKIIGQEYVSYSMSKPRVWPANSVGVYDWWSLRAPVLVASTISTTGNNYSVTASVSGATDPETAIEMVLPVGAINMSVYLNGAPAGSSDYRTTSYGVKVRVGQSVSNVTVQYSLQAGAPPVAKNDSYSAVINTALNQAAPGVLGNDTSPSGEILIAQLMSGPSHGSLTLNANGSFVYIPAPDYEGIDSFTYLANDGMANSDIATVTISVTGAGMITPHEITSAGTGGVCNAPANIAAGNLLIASFLQGSKSGNPVLPPGWVLDRTQDFHSYAYRLCVAHKIAGGSEPGTYQFAGYGGSLIYDLSIVRCDGNDPSNPVDSGAAAGSYVASSSADYTFPTVTTVHAKDLLYYVGESIGSPACTWPGGTLELYDPVNGHSAGYEIESEIGVSFARKITWSASSPERMGIVVAYKSAGAAGLAAVNDTYSTAQNTTLNQAAPGVLANDTGTTLSAHLASGPSHGSLMLNADGSFSYTPAYNYAGSDSFTYMANNGTTNSNIATVTITVTSISGVLFSDDFDRSLLAPWTGILGTWTITNGVLHGSSSSKSYASAAYTSSLWNNYTVEAQIQFPSGAFGGGIGGRVNPADGARYGAWIYPDGSTGGSNVLKLIKYRDWTTWNYRPMQQVSLSSVGTGWHELKMSFSGNQIQVFYDGILMINVTDNNYDSRAAYLSGGISADMWTYTGSYIMGVDNVVVNTLP